MTHRKVHSTASQISKAVAAAFKESWVVILWNDNVHDFDEAIGALMEVAGVNSADALKIACNTHEHGKAGVSLTTFERAEFIRDGLQKKGFRATMF